MFEQQKNETMNLLTGLIARILFAVPMAVFGLFHFMNAEGMAGMAPFGGAITVYITGACLIAAAVSILINKKAALATLLLGVFFILTALTVHLKSVIGGDEMAMGQILKDVALTGGAWFMSGVFKKEEESGGE